MARVSEFCKNSEVLADIEMRGKGDVSDARIMHNHKCRLIQS